MRYLLLTILLVVLAVPALPATRAGVNLADTLEIDGLKLSLNGVGLRKKVIFKVYVAGLYVQNQSREETKILQADEPRVMIMHFLRSVDAEKISGAWLDGLKANTPGADPTLNKDFSRLCSWMEDIDDGQQMLFTYRPGQGTEVKVKGKVKGVIAGKAFADALLACWIGPKPGPGDSFKADLLGKSK